MHAGVTANICYGTADKVRTHVDPFHSGLTTRQNKVKQCCRTELQSRAEALDAVGTATTMIHDVRQAMYLHIDSIVALV